MRLLGTTLIHWWFYASLAGYFGFAGWGVYLFAKENGMIDDVLERDEVETTDDAQADEDLDSAGDETQEPEAVAEPTPAPKGPVIITPEQSLIEIIRLQRECLAAEREYEAAKEDAKEAKDYWDTKLTSLTKYIQSVDQPLPLEKVWSQPSANGEATAAQQAQDESWRDTPLSVVLAGLPAKKLEILADAEIVTLGQLTDFQAAKGTYAWDLKGVGPEWRTKIEDAVVKWFERNPRQSSDAAAESPEKEATSPEPAGPDAEEGE